MDTNQDQPMQQELTTPPTHKDNAMKNIGVLVSFAIILVIVFAVIIARVIRHPQQTNTQAMQQEQQTADAHMRGKNLMGNHTISPTPNTSNPQLDQDVQDIQGSLNSVDTDLTNANQSINNASADTPQQ